MPCKQQSDIPIVYQTHVFAKLHKQIKDWLRLNFQWSTIKTNRIEAMLALSKYLVLLPLFLLASHANALTSLSSVAGDQVWVVHLIQLQQPMRDPMNEPSSEPICKPTNDQTTNEVKPSSSSNTSYTFKAVNGMSHVHVKYIVNNWADTSQPTVAKTSYGDEVDGVINAHDKHIGTGWVTISDKRDSEIWSIRPYLSLPWPN